MNRFVVFLGAFLLVAMLFGCSKGDQQEIAEKAADYADQATDAAQDVAEDAVDKAHDVADDAAEKVQEIAANVTGGEEMHAELGCGSCIWGMEGVKGCKTAVKIGDEMALLDGVPVDAHAIGLCKAAKGAMVKGEFTDGKFLASNVSFSE